MPSVSITDWLNSQCADRLISAVLIGHPIAQLVPSTGQPTPQKPTMPPSLIQRTISYTHTYIQRTIHTSTHNAHAQQLKLGKHEIASYIPAPSWLFRHYFISLNTLAISTLHFLKSLTFVNIHIVHTCLILSIILGCFLGIF